VNPQKDSGSHFIVARPVAILMVFLAAVVFGYLSLGRLPVTLMPELTYPTLTVRTVYPGAAPEEVENDIGRPIEEALGVVGGLQTISSINRAGVSDVVLEFTWDVTMSDATQDVLEKLDRVFLPVESSANWNRSRASPPCRCAAGSKKRSTSPSTPPRCGAPGSRSSR